MLWVRESSYSIGMSVQSSEEIMIDRSIIAMMFVEFIWYISCW